MVATKWAKEHGLINSYQRIKGGSDYDPRDRVITKNELRKYCLKVLVPYHFNQFIQFAYYTGARSGEIRRISRVKLFSGVYARRR